MKKLLMGLGVVFAVLLVIGVIGFAVLARNGNALDNESKAYVDKVVPEILTDLTKEHLFMYASEELKGSASPEEFDKIFKWFGRLGKFKNYQESKGEANIFVSPNTGKRITGQYVAQADFENGPATIQIATIKTEDKWHILGFHINSNALMDK